VLHVYVYHSWGLPRWVNPDFIPKRCHFVCIMFHLVQVCSCYGEMFVEGLILLTCGHVLCNFYDPSLICCVHLRAANLQAVLNKSDELQALSIVDSMSAADYRRRLHQ